MAHPTQEKKDYFNSDRLNYLRSRKSQLCAADRFCPAVNVVGKLGDGLGHGGLDLRQVGDGGGRDLCDVGSALGPEAGRGTETVRSEMSRSAGASCSVYKHCRL